MPDPQTMAAAPATPATEDLTKRISALEEKANEHALARDKEKARADAAAGEVERLKAKLELAEKDLQAAQSQNEAIAAQVKSDGLPPLPIELPGGAYRLLESVTTATGPDIELDGKKQKRRIEATRGDVMLINPKKGDAAREELQQKLGSAARVWVIDGACADDLARRSFIDPD